MVGGFKCKHCGWPGWREHRVVTKEGAHARHARVRGLHELRHAAPTHVGVSQHANHTNAKVHAKAKSRVRKMSELFPSSSTASRQARCPKTKNVDVTKDIDTTATELHRDDSGVGTGRAARAAVTRRAAPTRPAGARSARFRVQDHQALGKTDRDRRPCCTCARSQASHEPLGLARTRRVTRVIDGDTVHRHRHPRPRIRRHRAASTSGCGSGRHQRAAGRRPSRARPPTAPDAAADRPGGAHHHDRPVQVRRRRLPGEWMAVITLPDGRDVAGALVAAGVAVAWDGTGPRPGG
jgi:endonuclease YncB( thermonuclease family)